MCSHDPYNIVKAANIFLPSSVLEIKSAAGLGLQTNISTFSSTNDLIKQRNNTSSQ